MYIKLGLWRNRIHAATCHGRPHKIFEIYADAALQFHFRRNISGKVSGVVHIKRWAESISQRWSNLAFCLNYVQEFAQKYAEVWFKFINNHPLLRHYFKDCPNSV